MFRATSIGLIGVLFATAASAADNGVYLGAGISQASIDVEYEGSLASIPLDEDNTKFKVIAGVRALDWLAFELNYVDFGTIETPDNTPAAAQAEFSMKGIDAFAIGLFEVGVVDFFAKAGVVKWDAELTTLSASVPDADDDDFDPAYGAGIQVHFGSLGVRGEYEMFDIEVADVSMVSLSVYWTFL